MTPLLADALITWTPLTFYIAAGIVQAILTYLGFKLLQVDPEQNTIIGALVAGAVMAVAGYLTRDMTLVGVLISSSAIFGSLVLVSSGEALKAIPMTMVCMATYYVLALGLVPRTPLTHEAIGGLNKVFQQGGLQEEAIESADEKAFYSEP